ncbi:MAG: hypothetical protein GY759_07175 [Chloroflexi bacterium]|nr:hypothetical protein [Chloroflexota bacterium]
MSLIKIKSNVEPSYKSGYAKSAGESANPGLWDGLQDAWVPQMGPTGLVIRNIANGGYNAELQSLTADEAWQTGRNGSVVSFDGTEDYASIESLTPRNAVANLSQSFSVVVNAVTEANGTGSSYVYSEGNISDDRAIMGIRLDADGLVGMVTRAAAGPTPSAYVTGDTVNVSDGDSHTIVATYQKAHTALWVDGRLSGERVVEGLSTSVFDQRAIAALARTSVGSYSKCEASVVLCYVRALLPNEIKQLHADPLAPFRRKRTIPVSTPGEVAPPTFNPAWAIGSNRTIQSFSR